MERERPRRRPLELMIAPEGGKTNKMEDDTVKVKKKSKTGPLKSTPGFLKCMRNVYLYFKEEKEKGALNIPINSFIERTAVACGVGRKTLYNYAKKGLFDEHPVILQPKQKKKKDKLKKGKEEGCVVAKRGKKKCSSPDGGHTSSSSIGEKISPSPSQQQRHQQTRMAKNAMIQTDPRPVNQGHVITMENSNGGESEGFASFMIAKDEKIQHVQVVTQQPKVRETSTHMLTGAWTTGGSTTTTTTIKREVDYLPKNNIWHAVYNLQTPESATCTDIHAARITTCQQQTTSDHLTDL